MDFTFEEQELMAIYNPGTRLGLIQALNEMRTYLDEDGRNLGRSRIVLSTNSVGLRMTCSKLWIYCHFIFNAYNLKNSLFYGYS